jgi:hypothetical protein
MSEIISIDEARVVCEEAVKMSADGVKWETFSPELQLQAIAGVIRVVNTLQALGWRIHKPLKLI